MGDVIRIQTRYAKPTEPPPDEEFAEVNLGELAISTLRIFARKEENEPIIWAEVEAARTVLRAAGRTW